MSRSLPVLIFCKYCVPIQKLGRSLFILSRTFRFNEIGAKPNRHIGATDQWLVESRSSNKNAHNKSPKGKWYKYCFNFKTDFWLMTKLILFLLIKTITIILFLLVIAFYCYDTSVAVVAKVLVMKLFQNFLFVLSVRIYTRRKI